MNGARSVPIASTGNLPSVPHLLPIGFGTAGQRQKLAAGVGFRAIIIPERWADVIPEWLGEFTKAEPRLVR